MNCLNLLNDIAAQAGYTIASAIGQDAVNKARAIRRLTMVKADVISRYGGKWDANYREGWLPLVGLDITGTADWTNASQTITGHSTTWTTAMKGYKIKGPDNAWYKIASVVSATSLVITQPFQGTTTTLYGNSIWKDEYKLFPEVLTLGGLINFSLPDVMQEAWPRNTKDSYPNPGAVITPEVYTVVGRSHLSTTYSTGTVSATINTNTWTGVGTSWLANVEPGMSFVVGAYTYHIRRVNSDTELETYQLAISASAGAAYTVTGRNSLVIRFNGPTSQQIVSYWYWAKDYPFVNDNDEDWIAENYPKVLIDGVLKYDYMDKADVIRVDRATMAYEDAIKNMKVAVDGAFTGPRTLGYYIPDLARE